MSALGHRPANCALNSLLQLNVDLRLDILDRSSALIMETVTSLFVFRSNGFLVTDDIDDSSCTTDRIGNALVSPKTRYVRLLDYQKATLITVVYLVFL